jgi:hypothetical protein
LVKNLKEERVGLFKKNIYGSTMEIIEYKNSSNILVKFEQGEPICAEYSQFHKGTLRNPYEKTIFGIGYLGKGEYKSKINFKHSTQYRTWYQMFVRCYDAKYHEKFPTYRNCSVADEWHNFQNFAAWYDHNYYEVDGERIELDKDILIKGNRVYSPDTCVFVPQNINYLFTKRNSRRGKYPIGVHYSKRDEKFVSQCMDSKGGKKGLGHYDNPLEAFQSYKVFKEKLIKQTAIEYKDVIPDKLYNALLNYIVEVTD